MNTATGRQLGCFRMAPELRRCAIYGIVGCLALTPVGIWVATFVGQNPAPGVATLCVMFSSVAVLLAAPLRWALVIDQQGVARRVLFRWDRWRWSDFASGRIQKRHPNTFVDPERPWGRRTLRLHFMCREDIKKAIDLINAHYRLPRPPEIPETLRLKYRIGRSATLDSQGIHLLVNGQPHEYLWSELRRVHLTRMDPLRRDFTSLEVFLPDQEIELKMVTHQGGTSPTWRGATPEQVGEFLRQHVPTERLDVDIHGERPRRREDAQRQLEEASARDRSFRIMLWVFLPLIGASLVWMAFDKGLLPALAMTVMSAVLLGPLIVFVNKEARQRVCGLEKQLASFDAGDAFTPHGDAAEFS